MATDTEIPTEAQEAPQNFIDKMETCGEISQWERYIQTFRFASTRDREVVKGHVQFGQETLNDFPEFKQEFCHGMKLRGWEIKNTSAPKSVAFKSVMTEVIRSRGW